MKLFLGFAVAAGCFVVLGGCRSSPPPQTGFLSDYSKLEKLDRSTYRYISPELASHRKFTLERVELLIDEADSRLKDDQLAEAAAYFTEQLAEKLRASGLAVQMRDSASLQSGSAQSGPAVIRFAITDIRSSTVLLNLHPVSKLTGAGTGGAAMEGEIIDPVKGIQLAAFVQSGRGNQFELDYFSRLNDAEDVIDQWTKQIVTELQKLRDAESD